jgi:hypothetical protein
MPDLRVLRLDEVTFDSSQEPALWYDCRKVPVATPRTNSRFTT